MKTAIKVLDVDAEIQDLKRRLARSQQELDAERALWHGVVEGIADEVWGCDVQGRMHLINLAPVTAMGLHAFKEKRAQELLEEVEILNPDGQPRALDQMPLLRSLRGETVRGEEIMRHRLTGTVRFRQFSSAPTFGATGQITGAVAIVRDITDQKQAEDGLRRLAAIVESASSAIILKDFDGIVLEWNKAAERIYGYTAAEIVGKPISILVPPSRSEDLRITERIQRGERIDHYETVRVRKDGRLIQVSLSVAPILDAEGKVIGGSTIARDITEQKRAEERLRQTETIESLSVLAGGIAHDFNNLLMVIMGCTDLLKGHLAAPAPEAEIENIRLIEDATRRAAELCRQMLAYAGRLPLTIEPLNLTDLVHGFTPLLRSSISRQVALRYDLAAPLPPIDGDATQLRQVVLSLVLNASEAIGNRAGTVTLRTELAACNQDYLSSSYGTEALPPGNYVCLEVADTGGGMADETRKKMFEPFFTTKFAGRGLGLSSVLGIVQAHKGAIQVDSAPGLGATFRILFPASLRAVPDAVVPPASDLGRANGTILLVDDDEIVRGVTQKILERLGYSVIAAADGHTAIELFQGAGSRVDCVVLDTEMPAMDGAETCRELRRLNSQVKVMVASGYSEKDILRRYAGQSLDGFLQKPYAITALRETLGRIIAPRPSAE